MDRLDIKEKAKKYEFYLNNSLVSQCRKEAVNSAKFFSIKKWIHSHKKIDQLVVYMNDSLTDMCWGANS